MIDIDKVEIVPGGLEDLPELTALYDEVTEYLESHTNYPGWKKGIYPTGADAEIAVAEGTVQIARADGKIVGTYILNNKIAQGYDTAPWKIDVSPDHVAVLHTFMVHPIANGSGLGKLLLAHAKATAIWTGMETLRLDVYRGNLPAISLYEAMGYEYISTVDLGYQDFGLDLFKLYELVLPAQAIPVELKEHLDKIRPLNVTVMEEAKTRWNHIAKPLHSLGILEDHIVKMAGISETSNVSLEKCGLLALCSDNGIVEEGVTQTGQEVTAVVAENMTKGESCVCIMAKRSEVDVFPVDMGVARDLVSDSVQPLINRKIAYGTKNFHKEPAMTRDQAVKAIVTGIQLVSDLAEQGYNLIATGEMGIGNTTTSSAVSSMLLLSAPDLLTGRGAGLTDEGLKRKIAVIKDAMKQYQPQCKDAVDVIACVGGFDLAGLTGVFLGGAIYRIPVIIDGFITATAALTAERIYPGCRDFMLASHISAEPAGSLMLEKLGLEPMIQAHMCLGEGTGAVAAAPLLRMALDVYQHMSSFQEIEIEEYQPLGGE